MWYMGCFRLHVTAFSSLSGSFTKTQPIEDFYRWKILALCRSQVLKSMILSWFLKSYTGVTFETAISKVHFHSLMKEAVKILQWEISDMSKYT